MECYNHLMYYDPRMNYSTMIKTLKECITNGYPIIFEIDNEEIELEVSKLLSKQIDKSSEQWLVTFDSNIIDFSKDFEIYMVTKL